MSTWTDCAEHALTAINLERLLDNTIAAIRVPAFATAGECAAFSSAAKSGPMQFYDVADHIGYIGLAQYQYRWNKTKQAFLGDVPKAQADVQSVFDTAGFNPLQRMTELLRRHWPNTVDVAREDGQPYFAGIILSLIHI